MPCLTISVLLQGYMGAAGDRGKPGVAGLKVSHCQSEEAML